MRAIEVVITQDTSIEEGGRDQALAQRQALVNQLPGIEVGKWNVIYESVVLRVPDGKIAEVRQKVEELGLKTREEREEAL